MKRKILAVLVSAIMILEVFPVYAFAGEEAATAAEKDSFYYVALGDSIAAGYGLNIDDEDWAKATDLSKNYKNSDPACYPSLVADALKDSLVEAGVIEKAEDFDWSNLGIAGFKLEDYSKVVYDEDYQASFFDLLSKLMPPETPDAYHFHDLYVEEIQKADLMTVQLGANNLLWGLRLKLLDIALDGKSLEDAYKSFLGIPVFDVGKNGNPALVIIICYLIAKMLSVTDKPVSELTDTNLDLTIGQALLLGQILYYTLISDRKITLKDINEAIGYMMPDSLESILKETTEGVYDDYKAAIDAIYDLNPDVDLVIVNQYCPFGSSLELDGIDRDFEYVINALLAGVQKNFHINKRLLLNLRAFNFRAKEGDPLYDEFWGSLANIASLTYQTVKNENGRKLILSRLLLSPTCRKKAMLATTIDAVKYPLLYTFLGRPAQSSIKELNSVAARIADEYNLPLVDIYDGMPNEANIDPHPKAEGHKFIAGKVLETLEQ